MIADVHIDSSLPAQYEFWNATQRIKAFIGGIGSGKTLAGCVEIARKSKATLGMVIAPTYPMLRDATQRAFFDHFRSLVYEHRQTEGITTLVNGTQILWRSADKPDSLRGPNLDWFWLDEADYMDGTIWDVMLGRIRRKGACAWVTTSPNGIDNWVYKRIVTKSADRPDQYMVATSSTMANKHLPKEYIDSLIDSYTSEHARQELYGEFISLGGRMINRDWIIRGVVPDDHSGFVMGVDLAISTKESSDDRAIVVMCKKDSTYHVVDYATGKWGFYDTQKQITQMAERYNVTCIAVENVAYQQAMVETLQRETNYYVKPVNPRGQNKKTRFFPVAGKYENGYIVHNIRTDMRQLEDELCNFDGQGRYPDNLIDALIYAVEACETNVTPEVWSL